MCTEYITYITCFKREFLMLYYPLFTVDIGIQPNDSDNPG